MPYLSGHRRTACAAVVGLVVAIVLMVSGIAAADDAAAPADGTTTTTTPASTDPPAPTADSPATDPSTTDPSTTGTPPADPSTTVSQGTTVDNSQTGVANTGVNTAVGNEGDPAPATDPGTAPAAAVTSGAATATGGASQDAIVQEASAVATQAAHIVITQLALIVNIGVAAANSGANVAAAGSGAGAGAPGVSLVSTGDASVTGLGGSTAVTQVVDLLDAPEHTTQTAAVTNVGVGVGNTGANLAVGQMSGTSPDGTTVAVSWGPADSSSVGTGGASAIGDMTHTTIVQVAMGTAADDGTLRITQRAVVVNFGAALANSGFDLAGGSSADATALLVRGIVLALLTMLQPSAPTTTVAAPAASSGGSVAAVRTGSAVAVGDSSSTSIRQLAVGSVTGDHQASADQTASVGNFGFSFANTGANAAGALPVGVQAQLASIPAAFTGFLALLAAPGAQAAWSTDLELGAELLAASASVSAVESLFDLPNAPDGSAAQVVVRQITGILNLMISVAVSGQNDASTVVDAASTHDATTATRGPHNEVDRAVVRTGDADVSNQQHTTICQVIDVSASVCAPPTPTPPSVPVTPVVAVLPAGATTPVVAVTATQPSAALAFTGTSSLTSEVGAAVVVLFAGLLLVVVARRRRATGGAPAGSVHPGATRR